MAKMRIERKRVTRRKTPSAAKKSNQDRATQGVAKPTRPRGRSTRLEAGKGVVDKPNDVRGRLRKLRIGEEVEVLAKDNLMASNEANTAIVNEAGAHRFLAIDRISSQDAEGAAKSGRKSEHIDAALDTLSTSSNPATVITIPRPRARFAAKGQSQNLGILMADLGNYTTIASRVLGLGELEDIDFWNGAAAARGSQIR
ncbi:uncharacterized protein BCR38DRAFT_483345 [Pseudomassariella vexata]|uniref:Uncharacterized protein n=1 Tax=Pseudomassariella vexata TaxID=1141098 RepID=A0A1Y2E842_9PEZI|nr:uncharacterized protein BCR38DRAFT_483345 [Pseudomassariella vexata]ORY67738.1 hypothetical protein BCR38DRAFT_483345 [Pseudomassariella vexata]